MKRENFKTPVWRDFKSHIEARLEELREQNDSTNLSVEATAAIRGRIAELKDFLDLEVIASSSANNATLSFIGDGSETVEPISYVN